MTEIIKIGIFGYYSYRNLGDNLMAYLLSAHVRREGHEPIVFSKTPADMESWGVEVSSDVRDLVERSDVIFFGGGGLLIPRPTLSGEGADFNNDLRDLLVAASNRNVPLYAFSIGGAGKKLDDIVPKERRRLIRSLQYITLRNEEDLQLLVESGTPGEYLHDLVWTTSAYFPVVKTDTKKRRKVGINLYLGRSRRFVVLAKLIELIVRIRSDIDFVFLDINPGPNGQFNAYCPRGLPMNSTRKTLVDIQESCRAAAALDLLITTRLHIGVMAMCYGVTSVAYAGQVKTRLLYSRIGRNDLFWRSKDLFKFVRTFFFPGGFERLIAAGARSINPEIFDSAMQHYDRVSEVLATTVKAQASTERGVATLSTRRSRALRRHT